MAATLTIHDMKARYPNEWVLIADAELDKRMRPMRGRVIAHSAERDAIYRRLLVEANASLAIEYTGEPPLDWAVAL